MADLLMHDPEGDRNPYVPVPWSRYPLEPSTDESFMIGVRAAEDVDDVVVEWRTAHQEGRAPLEKSDDVWTATIGPFADECRYRFIATRRLAEDTASKWFTAPITRWESVAFTGISTDDEHVYVTGDSGRLTLTPRDADTTRWTLDQRPHQHEHANTSEPAGWEATLEADNLVLSRHDDQLILSADVARTDGQPTAWRLRWRLDPDERILGTGERFDTFDQRGSAPDVRVYEEYKQQGARTYFPVPWLLSTKGYGLAIDGAARVHFDLGAKNSRQASATIPSSAAASGTLYFGSPKQIIQAYVSDIGLPSPMPDWAYGPWMSGNEWDSDRRIRDVVNQTHDEGIPATVLVIEAWSDEATFYLFNDATYDVVAGADPVPADSIRHDGKWPDPKGLVDWLHERGIRVLLWQIPVLKDTDDHEQQVADIEHADAAGLCVGTTGGEPYRNRGWWFPNSRIIDLTNPEAREWWFSKRAYLLDDIGIDGFKTDGGEHLWGNDVSTFDGATGHQAANTYPTHYLESYHEFMRDHGHDQPLTFSRAGFTGSQSLPAHWAGDEDSTWDAYRASLTAGLSAGASGIAFWGWDLAGFSGDLPSAELYKRATAMAAFSPIMQYHSEHNEHRLPLADRTPWNVAEHTSDSDVTSIYRFYARLRMNLIPYLLTLGTEATQMGLPILRALAIEHPDDPQAITIDDQFLLGRDVLVAPVMSPGATERDVYLPEGEWRDLWTGKSAPEGWVTAPAPVDVIPVYVRAGACIPLWMPESIELGATVGLPADGSGRLVLMVFPGSADRTLVDPITSQTWTAQTVMSEAGLTITTTNAPSGITAWIPGADASAGAPDQYVPLSSGDAVTTIDLAAHDD